MERLSADTSLSLDLLASLSDAFEGVETQTTAFQKQCEGLIAEQNRLEGLASGVAENLQFYGSLELITKRLNAPGAGSFVHGQDFSGMLGRLDECIDYMNKHQSQKEALTYRSRYQQLLTRGLTLIRGNFMNALKDISADVSKRIADKQLNDTTMSTLLYAKFSVGASNSKVMAREIRKRAIVPTDATPGAEAEYQSLMNELYAGYGSTRGKLIKPLVKKKVSEIAMAPSSSKDLVAFARSSISYIRGVCSDEYDLWREWFEGVDGLYEYLEDICEPLYDHLRPRIIHENQLIKLCELCTLLQTRYFKDLDEEPESAEPDQLDFAAIIRPALEDSQTRLVFRTLAILRDDIENFKPKPADLELPLQSKPSSRSEARSNGPVTSGKKGAQLELPPRDPVVVEEEDERYGLDYDMSHRFWYPTLRRAIWLLSRIYRLVNVKSCKFGSMTELTRGQSTVFDDLAHQIVHHTTLSLQRASTALTSHKTPLDGQLFLLKYLLTLKQQIVAFDIEYITPDVTFDFSGVTSTFYELRDRGGLFDPRALWRLVSGGSLLLPRVVANMLDAKAELDGCLRAVIHDLCAGSVGRITAAVPAPASAAADAASSKKAPDTRTIVPAVQAAAAAEVPRLRQALEVYIDDARTRETLVGAVRDQAVLNYEAWHEPWSVGMRRSGRAVSAKGKGKEGDVWDPGVFAEWVAGVFRVGRGYGAHQGGRSVSGSRGMGSSTGASVDPESDADSIRSV